MPRPVYTTQCSVCYKGVGGYSRRYRESWLDGKSEYDAQIEFFDNAFSIHIPCHILSTVLCNHQRIKLHIPIRNPTGHIHNNRTKHPLERNANSHAHRNNLPGSSKIGLRTISQSHRNGILTNENNGIFRAPNAR